MVSRLSLASAFVFFALSVMPATPTMAQISDTIVGEYTVGIARDDIPVDQPDGFSYIGRWRIAFNTDGTYFAERLDIGRVVEGNYQVSGSHLTVTDESGLLSCSSPMASAIDAGDISVGEYEWTRAGDELNLVMTDDGCRGRVLLFSTRSMETFVPCATTQEMIDELNAEVPAVGTPIPASPESGSVLPDLTPPATLDPTSRVDPVEATNLAQIESDIDSLVLQLSACWATQDPDMWLPLLSSEFRAALLAADPEFESTILAAMGSPIEWERAGDIQINSPTSVSTILKTTTGPEEDFARSSFVLEGGRWRWNGAGS